MGLTFQSGENRFFNQCRALTLSSNMACNKLAFRVSSLPQKMSDEQLTRLFSSLEGNSALETLCMANTGISDRHLDALTAALLENHGLRTLK